MLITSVFLNPGDPVDRRLTEAGLEPIYKPCTGKRTEEEMIELLRGIAGAIVSTDPCTARVLDAAQGLKVISRTGVGYDAIDVSAATARGVIVTTTPGVNRHAVADLALGLILCCTRRLPESLAEVRQGGWKRHEGVDLVGKTLGIIGLGTIGSEADHRAGVTALLTANRRQLSLVDCVSFLGMRQLNLKTAFAFDRDFNEQGFETLPAPPRV